MSVTFVIEGVATDYGDDGTFVNVSNVNAPDLLEWLGYRVGPHLYGTLDPRDLAARCRRRLWEEPRNYNRGGPDEFLAAGRVVLLGRPDGYLRRRSEALLRLAEAAQPRPSSLADRPSARSSSLGSLPRLGRGSLVA